MLPTVSHSLLLESLNTWITQRQRTVTFVHVVLKTASSFTGARSPPMGPLRCTCIKRRDKSAAKQRAQESRRLHATDGHEPKATLRGVYKPQRPGTGRKCQHQARPNNAGGPTSKLFSLLPTRRFMIHDKRQENQRDKKQTDPNSLQAVLLDKGHIVKTN